MNDRSRMSATPQIPPAVIPLWLLARLHALFGDPPHYEASFYGPTNMFLTTFFPASLQFIVKPQARLRDPPEPGERPSFDSYGQQVGTSDKDGNPDFLVSKGMSKLQGDVPFLIYENKRDGEAGVNAQIQIDRYMQWAREYQRQAQSSITGLQIYALLVSGADTQIYLLDPDTTYIHASPLTGTVDSAVQALLENLRQTHGNVPL
jgi:hypothetical protein